MNYLVIGGSGQLGNELMTALKMQEKTFIAPNSNMLDITNGLHLAEIMGNFLPNVVFNAAADTNVNKAQTSISRTLSINAIGPWNLAKECKLAGAKLIHISTDYVFSGDKKLPWETFDEKTPKSIYGLSKSLGEDLVMSEYPQNSIIFRTAWLYSPFGKNFVKTMVRKALSKEKVIRVVNDQTGQPTSAKDLAQHLLKCLDGNLMPGIYHLTNSGEATWFEFAREIFKLVGEDPERILPIGSSALVEQAPRPSYSVLSQRCWENTGIEPMRNWQVSLEEQIEEIKAAVLSEGINGN